MNPYLPEYEYVPDGEPHVFGDRVYIFGSHDRFNSKKFCMNDYVAYSAKITDLSNWRYEGVIYPRNQDPRVIGEDRQLWAPDVVCGKDGRYYLYYCLDGDGQNIGVAVCDTPAGTYSFYGIIHDKNGRYLGSRPDDINPFDPAVFIDDDGEVYLYFGNGFLMKKLPPEYEKLVPPNQKKACAVVRLEDDMVTLKTEPICLIPHVKEADGTDFEDHPFLEASSMRKVNGKYYLIYSSNRMHELCYATSSYPDKDFKFGGVIVSNAEIHPEAGQNHARNGIGNNHGSIIQIGGTYYVFYHRHTTLDCASRQGCAERIDILDDGSIPQVKLTSNGLEKPFTEKKTYPASMACHVYRSDVHTADVFELARYTRPYFTQTADDYSPEDGGESPRQYIANIQDHATVVFRYFDLEIRGIDIIMRGDGNGKLLLKNNPDEEPFATIKVQPSSEWKKISTDICNPRRVHSLCFCYKGSGTQELLEFTLR